MNQEEYTLDGNADKVDIPSGAPKIVRELTERTGVNDFTVQPTRDGITTLWISRAKPAHPPPLSKIAGNFPLCIAVRPDGHRRAPAHSPARPSRQ